MSPLQRRRRRSERLWLLLNGEIFYSLKEAMTVNEAWRQHYNEVRPPDLLLCFARLCLSAEQPDAHRGTGNPSRRNEA